MASGRQKPVSRALALCAVAVVSVSATAAGPSRISVGADFERLIGDRELVFVARDLGGGEIRAFAPERIDERHPPFSTFKIPNFLIALESGAIVDPAASRDWDQTARPADDFWPQSWRQAQSLETAFRRSAVWFFRDIALQVGGERYRRDLARFGYGNAAAPDGNDKFWLDGMLQISALEQVNFLTRLLEGEYAVDPRFMAALRAASLLEESGDCRLHGKTGAGPVGEDFDGAFEGWLVGWSQCGQVPPTVYALWTRGPSYAAIRDFRRRAAIEMLQRIDAYRQRGHQSHDEQAP